MNIIQKLRNLIFGKNEVVEAPASVEVEVETPVSVEVEVETPVSVEVEPTVQELITSQEEPLPKPKPKRKYNKKKKSTGESK
jgi:hypothetical protein